MRRLTAREYNQTVADLLGDASNPADVFDPDGTANGFDNQVSLLGVSVSRARQLFLAAQQLAARVDLKKIATCDPLVKGDDACADQFARGFGKRAFRRPVTDQEVAILLNVYRTGQNGADHGTGIRQMLQAMLVMPQFLYRMDVTPGQVDARSGLVLIDSYQIATRLSYTYLQTTPDAELLSAADSGQLSTPAQVATQVQRLLQDPRSRQMSEDFYEHWLGLDKLDKISKAPAVFPQFDETVRAAFRLEITAFLGQMLWKDSGTLASLFTANYSFRNSLLAKYYGDSTITGTALTLAPLPADRSAGLLTLGGFMTMLGTPDQTDPVNRGKFIRERILCQLVPPPPAGLNVMFPKFDPTSTTREKFTMHQSQALCASCHRLMDKIGLGFETFDGAGRYRTTESGKPVDASGELVDTDVDGVFVGAPALGARLATSRVVENCVTASWFQFVAGRSVTDADAATLEQLRARLHSGGQKTMLEAWPETDAFRSRLQGEP